MLDRKIEYLDSLGYHGKREMKWIAAYLDDHAKDQHLGPINAKNWDRVCPPLTLRQKDSCNCGVFLLAYADYRALGGPFTFSANKIRHFWKKIAQDILIG